MGFKRSKITKEVLRVSENILARATDLILVSIFFNLEFASLPRRGKRKAESNVTNDLEQINYYSLKRAFSQLKKKGLIQSLKEKSSLPKITVEGRKRLSALIPIYNEKRTWDGEIYVITYDLPIKKNKVRNDLRNYLKTIGCGLLQQSVWITPYNPKKLLEEFVVENNLEYDFILISSMGKDGSIGGMEPTDLLEKVYGLSKINNRYIQYLQNFNDNLFNRSQLIFSYLSILEDDPQLPFELLPDEWEGDKAYLTYKKLAAASHGE